MAGYSGKPLERKLGIKEGFRICFVNAPKGFQQELKLPSDVHVLARPSKPLDLVLLFVKSERALKKCFSRVAQELSPKGMLWIAWPKKSAAIATDLSFDTVQRIGLDAGLVDVKICAVNDFWSGLKFVYRLADRPSD
jgi:hypothetical protein